MNLVEHFLKSGVACIPLNSYEFHEAASSLTTDTFIVTTPGRKHYLINRNYIKNVKVVKPNNGIGDAHA